MATYFHGNSEIQGDGLQTLVLMNRGFVGYSDAQQPPPTNFVFLNSAGNSPNQPTVSHAPPGQTQQLVGFPLHSATAVHHQQDISSLHGGFAPRSHYNIYSSIDTTAARDFTRPPKGLSLSLSPQQTTPHWTGPMISPTSGDDLRVPGGSPSSASGVSNGVNGVLQSGVLSPKYLKAAQELLGEVVNVGKAIKNWPPKRTGESPVSMTVAGEGASGGATSAARRGELTTAERHEIQTKKARLVNMLDEVERRYRQYHHQMQMVICWFEQVAGIGSAKPYTTLALQTISRQFRCLKDTLVEQIRATSKSLGEEEDGSRGGKAESSRLKFIHHQLRQQGALQHLGMIQPNAWRPQRGLPERAVSVLRAWLFEHFLHPYPKDTDKIMLAKQTGLTRSQVSNWFINARVRLWKPMVEEMYLEEVKEQEQNGSEERRSKGENPDDLPARKRGFKEDDDDTNQNPPPEISVSPSSASPTGITIPNQSGFSLIRAPDMEGSPRKQSRTAILQSPSMAMHMNVKPGEEDDEQLAMSFNSGFGGYPIAEQFPATYSGNGVSLTLGLQHCESLSISGTHQAFLANQRRVEMDESNDQFGSINAVPSSSHSASLYEAMNLQNRKRFAAQLLHDFVA